MAKAKNVKKEFIVKQEKRQVKVKRLGGFIDSQKTTLAETQDRRPSSDFKKTQEGAIIFDPCPNSDSETEAPVSVKVEEVRMECYSEAGGVCIRRIETEKEEPRDYNRSIQTQQAKIVAKMVNGCLCLVSEEE